MPEANEKADNKIADISARLEKEMRGETITFQAELSNLDIYQKAAAQTGFAITILSDKEGTRISCISEVKLDPSTNKMVNMGVPPYIRQISVMKGGVILAIEKPQETTNHTPFWETVNSLSKK